MVALLLVPQPFYPIYFQRAVVLVHPRVDPHVMPLVLSHGFGVLNAVPLFVLVIFQYVVVSVSSNIAAHIRLSDAVRASLLIVPIALLVLILSGRSSRAKHR